MRPESKIECKTSTNRVKRRIEHEHEHLLGKEMEGGVDILEDEGLEILRKFIESGSENEGELLTG